ncbi:MAG: hypothetical protein ABWY26_04980 [Microbacterium sp.]
MVATAVLESQSTFTASPVGGGRRDVGLLLGAGDGRAALEVALGQAAISGGKVCVMRCVDNSGIRSPRALRQRSAAARAQLTRTVAGHLAADGGTHVTERLHVGTLASLLRTLEPSIGALVVDGPSAGRPELRTLCPVPVHMVGDADIHRPDSAR